jgi:fructose 5-dehydrogenase small subunit
MRHSESMVKISRRIVLGLLPAGACCLLESATLRGLEDRAPATASADFMRLCNLLTGFSDLDLEIGARLQAAFAHLSPAAAQAFARLMPIALQARDDVALMAAARNAGLGDTALALVAAWYTGTVGSGVHAQPVSYAEALMYRTVSDGLAPPTYAFGGPAWWAAPPPDEGVSALIAQHAPTLLLERDPSPAQS